MMSFHKLAALTVAWLFASFLQAADTPAKVHGFAMHGEPKYGPDFQHFDYVNPNAPKGGTLKLGDVGNRGGFDTFNPFLVKGNPAPGISRVYDTLTVSSYDEPFTQYGLVAQYFAIPEDRSSVTFYLHPEARFHDGHPITAEDVKFSFETLVSKGQPFFAAYYADVESVNIIDERTVHFAFKDTQNRELPLILGQLQVLPKHYWQTRDFSKADLEVPLGSGPYKVASFDPGKNVTYERVEDYWAKDLPVKRGFYNFDQIVYEVYLENTIALEAFKSGEFDFRTENNSKSWANLYEGPPFENGGIIKEEIEHEFPTGMQGFVFNTRRDLFKDRKVRRALTYALDFEWTNTNLFYGQYNRTRSYFSNSDLASSGLPQGDELAYLKPYKAQLPDEVFNEPYTLPTTQGDGNIRNSLREALKLLREAGWTIQDGRLTHAETGKKFDFEFLFFQKDFERVLLPFARNLERMGINMNLRLVDVSQYINRLNEFDFDMTIGGIGQSDSPGNEQRNYWHSNNANLSGSRNYAGIQDPVVDSLIDKVIMAENREDLVAATQALDRALLWGHYIIPNWHKRAIWAAYNKKLQHPKVMPSKSFSIDYWWVDPALAGK